MDMPTALSGVGFMRSTNLYDLSIPSRMLPTAPSRMDSRSAAPLGPSAVDWTDCPLIERMMSPLMSPDFPAMLSGSTLVTRTPLSKSSMDMPTALSGVGFMSSTDFSSVAFIFPAGP